MMSDFLVIFYHPFPLMSEGFFLPFYTPLPPPPPKIGHHLCTFPKAKKKKKVLASPMMKGSTIAGHKFADSVLWVDKI